jgi:hypothetical protein
MVIEFLTKNTKNAQVIIAGAIERLAKEQPECDIKHSLKNAIITQRDKISPEVKERLKAIIGKYVE